MPGNFLPWPLIRSSISLASYPSLNAFRIALSPGFKFQRSYSSSAENLPRVVQPPLWHSIVPKAFRKQDSSLTPDKRQRSKEWNPATFFICIFLLIGSNAIQILALKNEHTAFIRKTDSKIALLKEVLEKMRRGEPVDVEKVLGTGDPKHEEEWKEVIRNIEEGDPMPGKKDRWREKKKLKKEQELEEKNMTERKFSKEFSQDVDNISGKPENSGPTKSTSSSPTSQQAGFY